MLGQRVFQGKEIREFSRSCFPNGFCAAEIPMLLEQRPSKVWLARYDPLGEPLSSGDYSEESCFSAAIPTEYCPTITLADRKSYAPEYFGRTEVDTSIRNRNLGQVRNTLDQAARQRSTVSVVWSPMCPIRKVELFNFP